MEDLIVSMYSNGIERFNGEVRRRVKTISSFPDEDSAMKVFYYKSIESQ